MGVTPPGEGRGSAYALNLFAHSVAPWRDPELAKAVRFIRQEAPRRPLSLAEVTAHVVTWRSTLERRFRQVLG